MAKITFSEELKEVHKVDINKLCETLNIQTVAGKEFVTFALANALLFERKQLDYGSENVSSYGAFGVFVRITDKFMRLKHIYGKSKRSKRVMNESITDSFRDMSNLAIIATMVDRGMWPNE